MLLWSCTAVLLVVVAYRDVRASLCDSKNCFATKLSNFSCEERYEKDVELFKIRYGSRERYDHPAGLPVYLPTPYVHVTYIRLHDYWNSSKILEYNREYNMNVTHGLEMSFTVQGNRGNKYLFMKFSSTNQFSNANDLFYEVHPEKRVFNFSSSKTVTSHLCLQGLQTSPVSYTVLLTVFPEPEVAIRHWRPSSTIHYVSFSKDNLAVVVSNYPLKTDISVVHDTPSNQGMCTCARLLYLCKDSTDCVRNSTGQCRDVKSHKNHYTSESYTWSNRGPGLYFVKIEFYCVRMIDGKVIERDFFVESSFIEIPGSFRKDPSAKHAVDGTVLVKTDQEHTETSTTPFVVIGSLIAMVLLIVMYIAVGKKVPSVFCFLNRKKQRQSQSECIASFEMVSDIQWPDASFQPVGNISRSDASFEPVGNISRNDASFESVDNISRNEASCAPVGATPRRIDEETRSLTSSVNTYLEQWDTDQIHETIEEDDISLRMFLRRINDIDGCPVHG